MVIRIMEEYQEFDTKVVSIDAWYDRHTRSWCIQLLNKDGYQVGEASWVGYKEAKDQVVADLKAEYNI